MVDTHTHLNLSPLVESVEETLQAALDAGVTRMVVPGVTIETSARAVELATQYPMVMAAIGIHPEEAENGRTIEERKDALYELVEAGNVTAIGECGLDYSGDVGHEAQKELFQMQIDLVLYFDLPLLIHCRNSRNLGEVVDYDAYSDLLTLLKRQSTIPKFVLHCVSGPVDYVKEAISLGAYVSFAGNVTYPNAHAIRDILSITPLDRLLVETDAPFLSPQSKRGQTNEPANVVETGKFIADYLKIDFGEFDQQTTQNSDNFFRLQ